MRNLILVLLTISVIGLAGCSKDSGNLSSSAPSGNTLNGGGSTGQGGSLARFTVVGNYLYTIDQQSLNVFDITTSSNPVFRKKVNLGMNIETIFPFKNKLFIASNTAMFIYNISNPETPIRESQVEHFTGCDPVVANDSVAFLTIRGGNQCGSQINVLNIYDIKDVRYPKFITSMSMTNPFGLGLKNNILYVCDNNAGLRIIDVSNPKNPIELGILTQERFIDVIPAGDLLIGMLTDGIAYLDITDPTAPKKLAVIKN